MDVNWNHFNCISPTAAFQKAKLSTMKGWKLLRWDDIELIRETVDDDVPVAEGDKEKFQKLNEMFWEARDKLAAVNTKILKELLGQNGRPVPDKVDSDTVLDDATNILTFGIPNVCPKCHCQKLWNNIFTLDCKGDLTEFVKCDFVCDEPETIKRFKATISEEVQKLDKKKVLVNWEFPEGYPTEEFKPTAEDEAATESRRQSEALANETVPVKETFKPTNDSEIMKLSPELYDVGNSAHVYLEDDPDFGWTAYNVTLSKTDLDSGSNSVYKMQIAEGTKGRKRHYRMMMEWGRIGQTMHSTFREASLDGVKEFWNQKFKEMTGNEWNKRHVYKKVPGKYFMQSLDTGKDAADALKKMSKEAQEQREKKRAEIAERAKNMVLDPRVMKLVKMIFDKDMMKQTLQNAGLNLQNMPLGKIKLDQIKEAMSVLSKLSDVVSGKIEVDDAQKALIIKDCTARYYNYVPHIITGKAPLIDNDEKIKDELKLVETMCDVGEAMKLMEQDDELNLDEVQQTFSHYQSLHTKITPLDKASERYQLLEEFFTNNQETDNCYFRRQTKIVDIFEVEREGELERYKPHADDENRQLLYHGSRLTNFVGILSTGLRIAPPEAPCNGYRYGKGLYFANCASKSVQYCTYNRDNQGCMLFCEVAMGKPWETPVDKYMEKPQPGSDSTYALGMVEPDPKDDVEIDGGVKVHKGKIIRTGLKTYNSHSELVVYDAARVHIRYMIIFQV